MTASGKKITISSESFMILKEPKRSHLKFSGVNLMTDAFKIIVKYCHITPSGNRGLKTFVFDFIYFKNSNLSLV